MDNNRISTINIDNKINITCKWRCNCNLTKLGDYLVVTGNHESLGMWNVNKGLKFYGFDFPIWKASTKLELSTAKNFVLEYKYIVVKSNEILNYQWEPIVGNHIYCINVRNNISEVILFKNIWGKVEEDIIGYVSHQLSRLGNSLLYSESKLLNSNLMNTAKHLELNQNNAGELELESSKTTKKKKKKQNKAYKYKYLLDMYNKNIDLRKNAFILANNGNISDKYKIICTIGRGTWGEVYLVDDLITGTKRAAKRIPKYFVESAERFQMEIDILKKIDHPNIIRLYESFENVYDIYLIMNYCAGGELFDRLVNGPFFNESLVMHIMKQVLLAVAYCHKMNIVHRDLKPENFLFLHNNPWSTIKLIDFGLAAHFNNLQVLTTKAGSPYYVAPEVLKGSYKQSCDVWSCGVIMYILICGYPPFNGATDGSILRKIATEKVEYILPGFQNASLEALNLLKAMLNRNPDERITAEKALNHVWFSKYEIMKNVKLYPSYPFTNFAVKLNKFQQLSRLEKVIVTIIAHHLDENIVKPLTEYFLLFDVHGYGQLDYKGFSKFLMEEFNQKLSPYTKLLFMKEGSDKTGFLDYTKFIAACMDSNHYKQRSICKKVFNIFDIDKDGNISAEELEHIINLGCASNTESEDRLDWTKREIAELLDKVDSNNDGKINFEEFYSYVANIANDKYAADYVGEKSMRIMHTNRLLSNNESSSILKKHMSFY